MNVTCSHGLKSKLAQPGLHAAPGTGPSQSAGAWRKSGSHADLPLPPSPEGLHVCPDASLQMLLAVPPGRFRAAGTAVNKPGTSRPLAPHPWGLPNNITFPYYYFIDTYDCHVISTPDNK